MSTPPGVLVVDKPTGPTSHDMVDLVRRLVPGERVGHTGTLDPFASGVLPLCIGRATRLARFLSGTHKTYRGTIVLGVTTDTFDPEGHVVAEAPYGHLDDHAIREAARRFVGTTLQTPPAFSARKRGGVPAHRLARTGRSVTLDPRRVTVHTFRIDAIRLPRVDFEIECSAGTYIRSIAHDLGGMLGCGAHLGSLRRVRSAGFGTAEAHEPGTLREAAEAGRLDRLIVPMDRLDLGMPAVTVTAGGQEAMSHGRPLTRVDLADAPLPSPGPVRVRNGRGELIGIAVREAPEEDEEPVLQPRVVLAG